MHDVLRAGLVCLLGIPIAAQMNAEAAVFPLAITALLTPVSESIGASAKLILVRLIAHCLAAFAAVISLTLAKMTAIPEFPLSSCQWLIGCVLLLLLQLTRLRHPPTLASGGGVLAGLPYETTIQIIVITAVVAYIEFAYVSLARKISCR